jgi:hypothetical protein
MLRVGVLADLIQRPWLVPEPVVAHVEVQVPLGALTAGGFLAQGSPLPPALTRPGSVAQPTGAVGEVRITAAHVRDLLAQLDVIGLQAPPGGSISFSFTDDRGALRAVATLRELRQAARRGCPVHHDGACDCPVIDRPEATDAYAPAAAQGRFLATRDRTAGTRAATTAPGGPTPTTSSPTPRAERPTARTCAACAAAHHRLKTFAPGWVYAMTADGILTVTTPAGVTRISRPPGRHLTGPRVLTRPPDQPPPAPDPADDPPPS